MLKPCPFNISRLPFMTFDFTQLSIISPVMRVLLSSGNTIRVKNKQFADSSLLFITIDFCIVMFYRARVITPSFPSREDYQSSSTSLTTVSHLVPAHYQPNLSMINSGICTLSSIPALVWRSSTLLEHNRGSPLGNKISNYSLRT